LFHPKPNFPSFLQGNKEDSIGIFSGSLINLFAVANLEHHDDQFLILNTAN
jgi:hypothetical protein